MSDQCTEFLDQLQVYLDGEVGPHTRAKVEQHLKDCPPCDHRADFEHRLKEIIGTACREKADDGLIDRVRTGLGL